MLGLIGTLSNPLGSNTMRVQVLDMIHERLYEQTMDAQDGVMYFLLDQMADQHVKELMMAYYVLLRHGEPLSHSHVIQSPSCHTLLGLSLVHSQLCFSDPTAFRAAVGPSCCDF